MQLHFTNGIVGQSLSAAAFHSKNVTSTPPEWIWVDRKEGLCSKYNPLNCGLYCGLWACRPCLIGLSIRAARTGLGTPKAGFLAEREMDFSLLWRLRCFSAWPEDERSQVKDVQPLYWLKAAFHDHISLPTTPATAKPLQVSSDAISQDRMAKLGLCYIFFRNTRRSWERKKQVLVCRVFGGAPLVPSNWVLNTDGGASITLDADPDPDLSKLSIMKEVDMIRSSHQSATSFWCRNGIQVTECCILVYDGKLFSAFKRGEQIIWNILKWSIFYTVVGIKVFEMKATE